MIRIAVTGHRGLPGPDDATHRRRDTPGIRLSRSRSPHRLDLPRAWTAVSPTPKHMQASLRMLDAADEVLAVWDGEPARGYGGTADVVSAARDAGVPVRVVWPDGATRD